MKLTKAVNILHIQIQGQIPSIFLVSQCERSKRQYKKAQSLLLVQETKYRHSRFLQETYSTAEISRKYVD